MDEVLIAKQILETILNVQVLVSKDMDAELEMFEKMHCFNTELQPIYKASNLKEFCKKMGKNALYEINESLETTIVLFYLQDYLVIIGPYTQKEWTTRAGENILVSLGISASYFTAFKLYKCQYGIVESENVIRAAAAMIKVSGSSIYEYEYQKITKAPEGGLKDVVIPKEYNYEQVNRRYALEGELMEALKNGDAHKAINIIDKLAPTSQSLEYAKDGALDPVIGTTIIRTLCRVASRQAGLAPIIIDAIVQDYAQKLYRASDIKRTRALSNEMITELCHEIRKIHQQPYSALVRKIIDFIQLNLSHDLSLTSIAKELKVSVGYLSKRYKKETGSTITNYISQARTKKAAELLASTKWPIQDISNYVGYLDSNYFVKVFKSQFGITPSEYREKHTL